MAKKEEKKPKEQNTESHYKLNTEAVDRLVNAKNKEYPKTNKDPGKQYRSKGLISKIPEPIKALFIKFWFNGAVCFFIFWGLGTYVWDSLDMAVIMAVVLGMVNDLLVNNTFHFFEVTPGSNDKWMMFPKKKFWTFFTNIVYSFIVLLIVIWIYNLINLVGNSIIGGEEAKIILGVEPVLFGVFYVAVDMLFIGMKNLAIRIVSDAKEKNGR